MFKPRRGMKGRDECKVSFGFIIQNKSFLFIYMVILIDFKFAFRRPTNCRTD